VKLKDDMDMIIIWRFGFGPKIKSHGHGVYYHRGGMLWESYWRYLGYRFWILKYRVAIQSSDVGSEK